MKSVILTSKPQFFADKGKGEKKALKLTNLKFIEELKKSLYKYDNILFVCASCDDYKNNEECAQLITKSLALSGIKFQISDLIDSRNWLFSKSLINNSDLVVLMDGNPLEQIQFYNDIELKLKLKSFNGCLLTIGSGTLNAGNSVYCSKRNELENSVYYNGLGLTNINIETSFNSADITRINEILLEDSKKKTFIALEDDSFIALKNGKIELYGTAYYFSKGEYKKIKKIEEVI